MIDVRPAAVAAQFTTIRMAPWRSRALRGRTLILRVARLGEVL
jgi:hypothetical protein